MEKYNKRGYLNSDFKLFHLTDAVQKEFAFHYHEFHKITIFIRGNVQYYVEGKTYFLKPYDIVLVNRGDIHRVQADPSAPYERIIVYISPAFMDAYHTEEYDLSYCFKKAKKEGSNVLRIPSLEKSSLFKIANRLEQSFADTEYAGSLYRQVLFLEFMIHLNRAAMKDRIEFLDNAMCNEKVVDILHYINSHLTEPLTIDHLSRTFYISKYHLMREFKKVTGCTIHTFLLNQRISHAQQMIAKGIQAGTASTLVGFSDYSLFYRSFLKLTGTSPKEYSSFFDPVPLTKEL